MFRSRNLKARNNKEASLLGCLAGVYVRRLELALVLGELGLSDEGPGRPVPRLGGGCFIDAHRGLVELGERFKLHQRLPTECGLYEAHRRQRRGESGACKRRTVEGSREGGERGPRTGLGWRERGVMVRGSWIEQRRRCDEPSRKSTRSITGMEVAATVDRGG